MYVDISWDFILSQQNEDQYLTSLDGRLRETPVLLGNPRANQAYE